MLLTSQTAVAITGNSRATPVRVDHDVRWAEFLLSVTSAATAAGDLLDVYVQASVDGGATWDDFIHFTQVLGNGGAKKFLARWQGEITPTTAQAAPQTHALSAGVAQGPHGTLWAVEWVIVTDTTPLFTFSVKASGAVKEIPAGG